MTAGAAGAAGGGTNSQRPLVSVMIVTYNSVEHLPTAIDSALAQTYEPIEVVVVDDGSTDGTAALLATYGSRIVVRSQDNRGVASARNAALAVARGEYLAFLDSDDAWLPDRLARLVAVLEQRPDLGMVMSELFMIDETVLTTRRLYAEQRKRPFPVDVSRQIPEIACYNFVTTSSTVFRRALVTRHGTFDERMRSAEDYDLWIRFLVGGTRAGFVDEPLGYYRIRAGSLTRTGAHPAAHQAVLERHLPTLWSLGARGNATDLYNIGTRLAAEGRRREAVRFFAHALVGVGARGKRARYAASSVRRLVRPAGRSGATATLRP